MEPAYQKETVSTIVPTYNNPEYARNTLKSIVAQYYRPLEKELMLKRMRRRDSISD